MRNSQTKLLLLIISIIILITIIIIFIVNSTSKTNIAVETNKLTLLLNDTYKIAALANPESEELKYEIKNTDIATINEQGQITAKKEGNTKIYVKSKNHKETINLTITNEEVEITGVELEKDQIRIKENDKYLITKEILPKNATMKNFTWTSSNPEIVTVDNGYITGIKEGKALITVKLEEFDVEIVDTMEVLVGNADDSENEEDTINIALNETHQIKSNQGDKYIITDYTLANITDSGLIEPLKEGSTTINIISLDGKTKKISLNITKESIIALNTSSIKIVKEEEYQLKSNHSNSIEWYSNNIKVATVEDGLVKGINDGEAIITVVDKNNNIDKVKVTVKGSGVLVKSISLEKEELTLETGKTYQIKPTILPTNATNKSVTYETTDTRVATVNDKGLISAKSSGICIITAYASNNKTASIKLIVLSNNITLDSLDVSPSSITIAKGENYQLTTILTPSNATDKKVVWTSKDNGIVSVNNGLITGNKIGTTYIEATSSGITSKVEVIVENKRSDIVEISSLDLVESNATMKIGTKKTLEVTYLPTNATNKSFIWTSSDSNVAKVSSTGIISALRKGSAIITCKSSNGKKDTVTINVINNPTANITDILLSETDTSVEKGSRKQLRATILPLTSSQSVSWSILDPNIATITDGLITGINCGETEVTATAINGLTVTTKVTVVEPKTYFEGPGDSNGRYRKTVTNNGRTYYVYYQADFGDVPFQNGDLAAYGCSAVSFAIAASGFNSEITPWQAATLVRTKTFTGIKGALDKVGISYDGPYFYNSNDRNESKINSMKALVSNHLAKGKPVIALVAAGNNGETKYAHQNHFITLLGETEDGSLSLGNCATEYGSLDELVRYYLTGGRKGFLLVG